MAVRMVGWNLLVGSDVHGLRGLVDHHDTSSIGNACHDATELNDIEGRLAIETRGWLVQEQHACGTDQSSAQALAHTDTESSSILGDVTSSTPILTRLF
jgi:hypothetical protein